MAREVSRPSRTAVLATSIALVIAMAGIWLLAPEPAVHPTRPDDLPFVPGRRTEREGAVLVGRGERTAGSDRARRGPAVPDTRVLTIIVRSSDGTAVEASIFMKEDGEEYVQVGLSRVGDALALPVARESSSLALVIRAPGHVPKTLDLTLPAGEDSIQREVTLDRAASLSGTVSLHASGGASTFVSGAKVFALPASLVLRDKDAYTAIARHPASLMATSSDRGVFVIDGAERGVEYRLAAYGDGAVGAAIGAAGDTSQAVVQIILKRIFTLAYRVVDESGADLPRYDGLFWWPTSGVSLAPGLGHIQHSSGVAPEALALFGVELDSSFADELRSRQACLIWYGHDASRDDPIGPLRSRVTYPGYESVSTDLYAFPLSDQPLKIQEISLRKSEWFAGFGTLSVGWTPGYERTGSTTSGTEETPIEQDIHLLVQIRLVGTDTSLSFDGQARGAMPGSADFPNVPAGEYVVWASAPNLRSFPKTRVGTAVVRPGETTRVTFDVPNSASLEVCYPLSDGSHHSQSRRFRLQWQGPREIQDRVVDVQAGRSFRQLHLEAGRYQIVDDTQPERFGPIELVLRPGEARVIQLPEAASR